MGRLQSRGRHGGQASASGSFLRLRPAIWGSGRVAGWPAVRLAGPAYVQHRQRRPGSLPGTPRSPHRASKGLWLLDHKWSPRFPPQHIGTATPPIGMSRCKGARSRAAANDQYSQILGSLHSPGTCFTSPGNKHEDDAEHCLSLEQK